MRWVQRRALILGGVGLLAVPTFFTVVPGWTRWPGGWRAAILAVWVAVAAATVAFDQRTGERLNEMMSEVDDARYEARKLAGLQALRLFLLHPLGPLAQYELRVYTQEDDGRLYARKEVYEGLEEDPSRTGWDPGKGACGYAFLMNEATVVRETACSDGTFHLTAEQMKRYSDLTLVSAVPIRNRRDEAVGVLTASSRQPQPRTAFTDGTPEYEAQVELATVIGRILIDLLGWASDE